MEKQEKFSEFVENAAGRFVILHHARPRNEHWDLMLENGELKNSVLITWAMPPQKPPPENFSCISRRLPDHRAEYLDFEGAISNNRGAVRRVDQGTFHALDANRFQLNGEIFRGELTMTELSNYAVLMEFQP